MKLVKQLFWPWLYCQTKLKKVFRWRSYVAYENGISARYNGIRRQNVAEHTFSKLLVFSMILPKLQNILGDMVDFNLLWRCIVIHDFGEGLLGQKFDISATKKTDMNDVEEWENVKSFLKNSGLEGSIIFYDFQKAFLLQFALTSYGSFPLQEKRKMESIQSHRAEKNAAILFQIVEKWEYQFYAYENKNKHPTISEDVYSRNIPIALEWIRKLPEEFHKPLEEVFIS